MAETSAVSNFVTNDMVTDDKKLTAAQSYSLMIEQLRDDGFHQCATTVSHSTLTPSDLSFSSDRLRQLVLKGLEAEDMEEGKSLGTLQLNEGSEEYPAPLMALPVRFSPDFGSLAEIPSRPFPHHDSKHMADHKNSVTCARFSPDGRLAATGSTDTSIKLFEVEKMRTLLNVSGPRDPDLKPVIRNFYDHTQEVNDVDFHPQSAILISGGEDQTIKFFDFAKSTARRAFRVIQDTHSVKSVAFHPGGDHLLAGTEHPLVHLYDVNTFQCFLTSSIQPFQVGGAINQVRYSPTGNMYVTCSSDGAVRVWDGVSSQCFRVIGGAHGGSEATSVCFSRDQKYILSSGKDSTTKLWEVSSGRQVKVYVGAQHSASKSQAVFSNDELFVMCVDEVTNEILVWDSLTGDVIVRLPSCHATPPLWLEHSSTRSEFLSCGADRAIRFWRQGKI